MILAVVTKPSTLSTKPESMVDGKHMPDCGVTGNKTKKPNGVS